MKKKSYSTFSFITLLKSSFITFCAMMFLGQILIAKSVDPSVAATVAKYFYQSTAKGASFAGDIQLSLVYETNTYSVPASTGLLRIFNVNDSDGFVLVAGDDAITPILGYSDKGSFDPGNLPDNFAKWLEGYQHEIGYAIENDLEATDPIKDQWETLKKGSIPSDKNGLGVAPLLTTTWNQSSYYNEFCPGGSVTGCVATAMAQVMNYWEFPIRGSGFSVYLENDYGGLFANYGVTYYKWLDMPDNVTGPNESVATLMYHCGVSVQMDYSPQVSGALPGPIPVAFRTYFGYDPNLGTVFKNNNTSAGWNNTIKAELDAARPVFYAGFGGSTGHAFVCDGYEPFLPDNELFHINWGWGGAYDGYFILSNLTPSGTGTGGGAAGTGYNSGQLAVIGIQPDPLGSPDLEMLESPGVLDTIFAYGEDFYVLGQIRNTGVSTFNGKVAAALFERKDDSLVSFLDSANVSIVGSGGISVTTFIGPTTTLPGFYYISYLYKAENSNNWVQVENTLAVNRTDIIILDESGGSEILWLVEQPSISSSTLLQNTPFTISAKLGNLVTFPSWSGEVAAELYSTDLNYLQTIEVKSNITINLGNPNFTVSFSSSGLDLPPGAYLITLRTKRSNSTVWTFPLALENVSSTTILDILPPPFTADTYEPNNSQTSAHSLNVSFTNDNATVNTLGSNMHMPEDYDFYKIELPDGYDYQITPMVHDSYSSGNGQSYSNDVRFLYAIGDDPFSESYDDVPFPSSFSVTGANTVHFRVNPYYLGTVGTYLLDIQLNRTPSTGVNDLLTEEVFRVYPNPANEFVLVELLNPDAVAKAMRLYGIDGQLVFSNSFNPGQENRIPTDELPNGLYILNVITEAGTCSKKVSINH